MQRTHKGFCSRLGSLTCLLSAMLALGGCSTLGPDYREPEIEWLERWQPDLYGVTGTSQAQDEDELRFWWRTFNDPTLNRLILAAQTDSPSLRIAGLRILESLALLGIADSTRYPQLQQALGGIDAVHTEQRGGAAGNDSQDLLSYSAGFNLGWELDFWGRFRRGIESADAAFFASIANQRATQVLLNAQLADLYFTYRTTELRIAIAQENAKIQQRSFEITEKIFHSGSDSELDLQQAKTQYLATLSTIPDLELSLTTLRNALCALLGRPPGNLPELKPLAKGERLPAIDRVRIQGIPANLLLRRPDLRAEAWQVAAQSAQIGIAEADYYPAISLLGVLSWSGSSIDGASDTGVLSLGPHLKWNLFDYGRIENNVRLQDARLQQLIENYQNSALQAAREIDDAAIGLAKTREQESILADSVQASKRALELANKLYHEGYADFQRVLDAQRALFAQEEKLLLNQGRHVSAAIAFYKALGGGWEATPSERLLPEDLRETMQKRTDWGQLLSAPLPEVP